MKIEITKVDAARRQLSTAITLWFHDGDEVSIHTLACAAYEVLHVVSKKRDKFRRDLLFDSRIIKDEFRGEWNMKIKEPANFFKHAKLDTEASIEFDPILTKAFILFAVIAVELSGEPYSPEEATYLFWTYFHEPESLTEVGRELFVDSIPADQLADLRSLSKDEFFKIVMDVRRALAHRAPP